MFGSGTREYFEQLPNLRDLDASSARRLLSSAYADVLSARDGLSRSQPDSLPVMSAGLRRLASALQAHAILPDDVGEGTRGAASFVAAEALALLLDLPTPAVPDSVAADQPDGPGDTEASPADLLPPRYRLETTRGLQAIECGLLYLTAGFDSNAAVVALEAIRVPPPDNVSGEAVWAERAYRALVGLLRLSPRARIVTEDEPPGPDLETEWPEERVRSELFRRIERAASDHLRWLSFQPQVEAGRPAQRAADLAQLLRESPSPRYADLAQVMVLLGAAIDATSARALREVPSTGSESYETYVRERANARPLVWPSTAQYAAACLPGPSANAVVALPTGSGKSFTAELAAAQALAGGWVLYLVPTNALASQVRRDLANGLAGLGGTRVRAFLGDGQYTELGQEAITGVGPGTVLVMTPEKCAMALRRSPDAFGDLRLCVFDECHQMRETGGRGAIAELVLSHVMAVAPECRLLLMSALVSNAPELSEWLQAATGIRSEAISNPWRPTRTLRAVVGFHRGGSQVAAEAAHQQLSSASNRRKNWSFAAPYALLANLQGAWATTDQDDYVSLTIPVVGELQWHRDQVGAGWNYEIQTPSGYVNNVVRDLCDFFATAGEKVLAFLPASRHHPFAVAARIDLSEQEAATYDGGDVRLDALLEIADWELGVPSVLRDALRHGAAIHTSSLVDAERQASETAFRSDRVAVMLATGTLAQGLNLPATMVIIGGTDVGDRRESRTPEGRIKSAAQIVNAIGRAGRPGVASRATAVLVPSSPVLISDAQSDIANGVARAEVLSREDAAIALTSPLEGLVGAALAGTVSREGMSLDELTAFTYLPIEEEAEPSPVEILSRSLGVWRRAPTDHHETAAAVASVLRSLGQDFLESADVPSWTATVATRSGLSLPEVFALYRAVESRLDQERSTLAEWLDLFGEVMGDMPPNLAQTAVDASRIPAGAAFSSLSAPVLGADGWRSGWSTLYGVLRLHLNGESIAQVARAAFGIESDAAVANSRSDGAKPIPKAIGLLDRATYRLSMVAGGIAALYITGDESAADDRWHLPPQPRLSLEMLPLAIRNGCGDTSSLSWFRFGIRHRRVAHLLGALMPVPTSLDSDAQIEAWVSGQRDRWLESGEVVLPADTEEGVQRLLDAARIVAAGDQLQ